MRDTLPVMAEAKRQIGIKTRAVKRLAADVKSYLQEKATHQSKLDQLASSSSTEAHELKRAREFVDEAESTIQDVRQRLQEAYTVLQTYLTETAQSNPPEFMEDQCVLDARQMLVDVAPLVTVGASSSQPTRDFKITVLGSDQLDEDDPVWRAAEEVGERLAQAGYHVLTGGYSGTSEAVSFGASRVASSHVEGVTCAAAFPSAVANQYLTVETPAADAVARTHALLRSADAVVIMPGGLDTLSEVTLAWRLSALEVAQGKAPLTLLAWRQPWAALIDHLAQTLRIPANLRETIVFVDSTEQVMAELDKMKAQKLARGDAASSSSSN